MQEHLIQEDWYNVSECMQCGRLYVRADPANAVRCEDCIHEAHENTRNIEAEQQANNVLGGEMAAELS